MRSPRHRGGGGLAAGTFDRLDFLQHDAQFRRHALGVLAKPVSIQAGILWPTAAMMSCIEAYASTFLIRLITVFAGAASAAGLAARGARLFLRQGFQCFDGGRLGLGWRDFHGLADGFWTQWLFRRGFLGGGGRRGFLGRRLFLDHGRRFHVGLACRQVAADLFRLVAGGFSARAWRRPA
jgi:methyl coenzyme M reductase beta subunit